MARRAIKRALMDSGIDIVPAKPAKKTKRPSKAATASPAPQGGAAKASTATAAMTTMPLTDGVAAAAAAAPTEFDIDLFEAQLQKLLDEGAALPELVDGFELDLPDGELSALDGIFDAAAVSAETVDALASAEGVPAAVAAASDVVSADSAASTAPSTPAASWDDYVDYESMCEDSGSEDEPSLPSTPSSPLPSRTVPLCGYRYRNATETTLADIPYNTKRFQLAWSMVAEDFDPATRTAYLQNVLLAATSLKQSSIVSGLARQTMAPPLVQP